MTEIFHRVRVQGSVSKHKYKADYFRLNKKVKPESGTQRYLCIHSNFISKPLEISLPCYRLTPLRVLNTPRDMTFPA